jgi:hypothetical protein
MTSLRLKRGTTTQNYSYTGPPGELTIDATGNQLRLHDGTTAGGITVGSLTVTSVKTSSYNANVNELVRIDSTAGGFTITLPASPSDGAKIAFLDIANKCGTNPVLVAANGKTILGDSTGISLDANGAGLSLMFNNLTNDWSKIDMFSSSFGVVSVDLTPDTFNFSDQTNVALSSTITSNTVTITGLSPNISITVSGTGGTIDAGTSALSGTFAASKSVTTSGTGTIVVAGRITSSGSYNQQTSMTITVGTVSDTWNATTTNIFNFTGFSSPSLVNGYNEYSGEFNSITVNSSGRFVAVGSRVHTPTSTNHPLTAYSNDGITWSTPALMNGFTLNSVNMTGIAVNSSGLFVAVGYHQTYGYFYSATSTDGINWTTPNYHFNSEITISTPSISVNSAGLFVAVGENKSTTSTNGLIWTTPTSIPVNSLKAITVDSSDRFIAVGGQNNNPRYAISTNGVNWTYDYIGSQTITLCKAVAVNSSGLIVVVGYNSNNYPVYYTSTNGTTWSNQNFFNNYQQTNYTQSIAVGPTGRFVVGGATNSGWTYSTSTDGSTWTTPVVMSGSSGMVSAIVSNSFGRFVATGTYFDKPGYMYSTN